MRYELKIVLTAFCFGLTVAPSANAGTYDDLLKLSQEIRKLEQTQTRDGIPEYTVATMSRVQGELKTLQDRFTAIDPKAWPIEQQVDFEIVRAEMNGFDFFIRVLQPWARDPAFYVLIFPDQSDTPDHEGPTSHAMIDLWKYAYPLSKADTQKLIAQLNMIAPLLQQARGNLTGNARDLWIAGIQSIRTQADDLDNLAAQTAGSGNE